MSLPLIDQIVQQDARAFEARRVAREARQSARDYLVNLMCAQDSRLVPDHIWGCLLKGFGACMVVSDASDPLRATLLIQPAKGEDSILGVDSCNQYRVRWTMRADGTRAWEVRSTRWWDPFYRPVDDTGILDLMLKCFVESVESRGLTQFSIMGARNFFAKTFGEPIPCPEVVPDPVEPNTTESNPTDSEKEKS